MKIGVVGLWHLGEIYSACLAELGHRVVGISENDKIVENLKKDKAPLPEPELSSILKRNRRKRRLSFTTDFGAIRKCNILWITVDTKIDRNDKTDLTTIFKALEQARPFLRANILIVVSSQLPVGTSRKIIEFINERKKKLKFQYAYVPENLRLGEAVKSFFNPGKVVVGTYEDAAFKKVRSILNGLNTEFINMSVVSSEVTKHATNAFLASSLSFINDIADISEKVGSDIVDIVKALRKDVRIGPHAYLGAGIGFSGGTLGRDLQSLLAEARAHKLRLPVIEAVRKKNLSRKKIVYYKLSDSLGRLKGRKIAVFGLTYKSGTTTLRNSLAKDIIRDLFKMGVSISVFDNRVKRDDIKEALRGIDYQFAEGPYSAARNCHAAVFITPWNQLKRLDFRKMYKGMASPAVFLDPLNFFYSQEREIRALGFSYLGVGR